jgi:hypothetical protein
VDAARAVNGSATSVSNSASFFIGLLRVRNRIV